MRRALVLALLTLTACRSKVIKEGVYVEVTNKSNAEIVQLKVTATSSDGSEDLWLPGIPQSTPIKFPTSFSISVPLGMTGKVDIVILGRNSAEATVAHGTASATLQPNTYVSTPIELKAVAIDGSGGSGGTGDTGGTGGGTGSGWTTSTGGTMGGGASGSRGGAGGTGGTSSSGGSNGSGGMTSAGGAQSTGGNGVSGGSAGTVRSASTGGEGGSGGTVRIGGSTGTGGATSTGGVTSTGGASGIGGSSSLNSGTGGASTSVVDCRSPGSLANGSVSVPATTVGATVSYSCLPGYSLTGPATRTCQSSGIWSGTAPTCELVNCGALQAPVDGTVSAPATTYKSTATYSCTTTGYLLSDDPVRTCQLDGKWSGSAPTCVPAASFGKSCSVSADCPSEATCCDGSKQTCDGTRLPTGDGTNPDQYVVSSDGFTVTDTITGLVWQRDGSGTRTGCSGDPTCTWAEAKAFCASLTLGGLAGWRLPGRAELRTIVDFTKLRPTIDQYAFPDTPPQWFWTSSPNTGISGGAWFVDFKDGGVGTLSTDPARVRCVR